MSRVCLRSRRGKVREVTWFFRVRCDRERCRFREMRLRVLGSVVTESRVVGVIVYAIGILRVRVFEGF